MKITFDTKRLFFDRPAIMRAVDRAAHRALNRAGGKLRLMAQRSMRYVSQPKKEGKRRKTSAPGRPPRAVRPHPWIRKHLYYAWDPQKKSVLVGPALFGRRTGAPARLEKGGRVRIKNTRRKIRRVGDGGEIDIGGSGATVKPAVNWRGETILVRYGLLHTAAQAQRANELNEWLYGPEEFDATIEPRPYMGPALEKMLPQLPKELAGTVRP